MKASVKAVLLLSGASLFSRAAFCQAKSGNGKVSAPGGEVVHIVQKGCPGEGGCDFKLWTTKHDVKIWAAPDDHAKVVASLAKDTRVKGMEAQTITTRVPLCIVKKDLRADISLLSGTTTTLHRGDKFTILMYNGEGVVSIRRGDKEMSINQDEKNENYTCQGELEAVTWVKVRLADGRSGWSVRDAFNGTSQYD